MSSVTWFADPRRVAAASGSVGICGALLGLALAAGFWAGAAGAQTVVTVETTGELKAVLALRGDAERGKAEFRDCGGCHRKDASGRANLAIPRLSGQHASVVIKQIVDIRSGARINTPMKPILDDRIMTLQSFADIASYLEALPVPASKDRGEGNDLARGKRLYETDCVGCHGTGGEGRADTFFPMLAGQHYSYLLRELGFIREGIRGNSNPAMAAILVSYTQDDLQAVAGYIARLPPSERQ